MEMPGYEPRTLQSMALGLAVNARGADHNRSGAYEADLSGRLDRLDGGAAHVAAAVDTEDRAAVMDSMILCKFLRGVFEEPFPEWAELLRPVTGWDVDADELRATARADRAGQAGVQPARGRHRGGRPAAGPDADDPAGARLRPDRDADRGAAAGHDRRLLRRPRARPDGRIRAADRPELLLDG